MSRRGLWHETSQDNNYFCTGLYEELHLDLLGAASYLLEAGKTGGLTLIWQDFFSFCILSRLQKYKSGINFGIILRSLYLMQKLGNENR